MSQQQNGTGQIGSSDSTKQTKLRDASCAGTTPSLLAESFDDPCLSCGRSLSLDESDLCHECQVEPVKQITYDDMGLFSLMSLGQSVAGNRSFFLPDFDDF